jgi:hypothetical protein
MSKSLADMVRKAGRRPVPYEGLSALAGTTLQIGRKPKRRSTDERSPLTFLPSQCVCGSHHPPCVALLSGVVLEMRAQRAAAYLRIRIRLSTSRKFIVHPTSIRLGRKSRCDASASSRPKSSGIYARGVIASRFYERHPPRLEYYLTDKGEALGPVLKA